jgi:hypothetical protein
MNDGGLPKLLVDWAQVLGAALSLLALMVALYALWKSKRDIADERRRQHDLEILREIGAHINANGDKWHVAHRILMISGKRDFPLTRAALYMPCDPTSANEFDRRYNEYRGRNGLPRPASSPDFDEQRWQMLGVRDDAGKSILRSEFNDAGERRLR